MLAGGEVERRLHKSFISLREKGKRGERPCSKGTLWISSPVGEEGGGSLWAQGSPISGPGFGVDPPCSVPPGLTIALMKPLAARHTLQQQGYSHHQINRMIEWVHLQQIPWQGLTRVSCGDKVCISNRDQQGEYRVISSNHKIDSLLYLEHEMIKTVPC